MPYPQIGLIPNHVEKGGDVRLHVVEGDGFVMLPNPPKCEHK
jgi:hypothetical protein